MAIVIQIKVFPRSGRNEWKLGKGGYINCYLKSAPEKGLANKELIQLLAKALQITQADVEIVSGLASCLKKIKISQNSTFDELLLKLGIHRQIEIFEKKR